ncbi:MAG: HypC/HybG/HupF family hydrogenase formation chaperone [candidate division KSB1 bacterium]|nr:HypC/HybG/HupF family hydrogenase formation chaperone [candidate division KSB1 bacterium]
MCLGVPMRVVSVGDGFAVVEVGGVRKEVSIQFLEEVREGDYVIVHAGFALQRIDPAEAQATLELFQAHRIPTDA